MWRKVSCEQPLNTSQSILRLGGSLVQCFGYLTFSKSRMMPKGNLVHIPEPGCGTARTLVSVVATRFD